MDRTFSDEASLVNTSAAWMLMGTVLETQPEAQPTCLKRTLGQLSTWWVFPTSFLPDDLFQLVFSMRAGMPLQPVDRVSGCVL